MYKRNNGRYQPHNRVYAPRRFSTAGDMGRSFTRPAPQPKLPEPIGVDGLNDFERLAEKEGPPGFYGGGEPRYYENRAGTETGQVALAGAANLSYVPAMSGDQGRRTGDADEEMPDKGLCGGAGETSGEEQFHRSLSDTIATWYQEVDSYESRRKTSFGF